MKHTNDGAACPSCEDKLKQAHPDIAKWFRDSVKPKNQDCHISWSFRGESDQNQCVADGKSKLAWPLSPHNKSDDQGNPCSMALDFFQLMANGSAVWPWKYFKVIADQCETDQNLIKWGGQWKLIGDSDHFQQS